jgi:predicted GIY-YIG superfamily endonuclease
MTKCYWVYIAELSDGRLYVGITNNPDRRAIEHRIGNSIRTTRIFVLQEAVVSGTSPELGIGSKARAAIEEMGMGRGLDASGRRQAPPGGTREALPRQRRAAGPGLQAIRGP